MTILKAAIGVMNELFVGIQAISYSHVQGFERSIDTQVISQVIAHDPFGECIGNEREEQIFLFGFDIGNV